MCFDIGLKKTFGAICGRFQPPHLGHEELIRIIQLWVEECYVGVYDLGVGKYNPFTYEERKKMLKSIDPHLRVFRIDGEYSLSRNPWKVMRTFDVEMKEKLPADTCLFTRDWIRFLQWKIMKALGFLEEFQVKKMSRKGPSASEVRKYLYNGKRDWRKMVGDGVEKIIEELAPFQRRIRSRGMTHLDKKVY